MDAVLDDGTPIKDLQAELEERRAEILRYKALCRTITNICNAPHWSADRRWKIRDLASDGSRGVWRAR